LKTEFFIARRVFSQKGENRGISNRIVSIAVGSISVGLAIMIVSVSVLLGFKKEIREKVIGFGSHFQVVNYDANISFETIPVESDSGFMETLLKLDVVTRVSLFATKPAIIKTADAIHPMVFKGVCTAYDWSFFSANLIDGELPKLSPDSLTNKVLLSEKQSKLLKFNVGDPVYCYFYNEGETVPRGRKFEVAGIYRTSLAEFDDLYVLGDIGQVQQVSGWNPGQISGYEIGIVSFDRLSQAEENLVRLSMNRASETTMLKVVSIVKKYPLLFDWLAVLDMNVWVLLAVVLAVAGINMVSGLLVIILERSRMIGTLKAMGYPSVSIRKIFLFLSAFLSARGLLWGNLIGVGICVLQYYTGIIHLDPATYYIDTVPISFNLLYLLLLNMGTLVGIVLMILLPSMYISKISPAEAIRFE
jgi:lipoprotein-releasing system permease protein